MTVRVNVSVWLLWLSAMRQLVVSACPSVAATCPTLRERSFCLTLSRAALGAAVDRGGKPKEWIQKQRSPGGVWGLTLCRRIGLFSVSTQVGLPGEDRGGTSLGVAPADYLPAAFGKQPVELHLQSIH